MNVTAFILRELRGQSRSAINYWLRVVCVACVAGFLVLGLLNSGVIDLVDLLPGSWRRWARELNGGGYPGMAMVSAESSGAYVFSRLNRAMILLLFAVTPALLSDSLSRERREATLGLLFLTPLNAWEVVASKVFAHGLRGVMLWLALLPVLPFPLLLGGVDPRDAVLAALFQLALVFLGMGSGILASSLCQRSGMALALALAINAAVVLILLNSSHGSFGQLLRSSSALRVSGPRVLLSGTLSAQSEVVPEIRSFFAVQKLLSFQSGIVDEFRYRTWPFNPSRPSGLLTSWQVLWTDFRPEVHRRWFVRVLGIVAGCAAWTLICIWISARRVTAIVRPAPLGKWIGRLTRGATKDPLPDLSRRWSRWLRSRNPFGWLGRQSWQNRMVGWLWLGAAVLVSSAVLVEAEFGSVGRLLPHLLGALAIVSMLFVSTMSFQRDRDMGVLELLLSSPASAHELAWGRLTSIWVHAMPAALFILWLIQFLSNSRLFSPHDAGLLGYPVLLTVAAFACVPVGLHQGLRCRHWWTALFRAGLTGSLLPMSAVWLLESWLYRGIDPFRQQEFAPGSLRVFLLGVLIVQGWRHWSLLVARLEQRRFPLN